jgi:uncharacterized membrane protein SirB2
MIFVWILAAIVVVIIFFAFSHFALKQKEGEKEQIKYFR